MYIEINGDIFKHHNKYDVLVHGCNCFCKMGGGIAKVVKYLYIEAYLEDCKTEKGDRSKLGTYTSYKSEGNDITIVNAYTQFYYSNSGKDLFEYEAFEKICKKLNVEFKDKTIAMPKIGAGLAGGDWDRIKEIIKNNLTDCTVMVFYL